jgi:hypothetical protein
LYFLWLTLAHHQPQFFSSLLEAELDSLFAILSNAQTVYRQALDEARQ